MRQLILSALVAALMTLALKGDCIVQPVKPVIPPGCRDLVLECLCDSTGNNCSYVWKCVPTYGVVQRPVYQPYRQPRMQQYPYPQSAPTLNVPLPQVPQVYYPYPEQ